jgi:photosystem II stability/assembly factor-like uncharacterized protein
MAMSAWQRMGPALNGEDLFSLTVSPSVAAGADCCAGQRILAGTRTGLFGSDNAGQDWRLMSGELGAFPVMATAFSPDYARTPSIFVGGAPGAVLRSLDAGKNWESCSLDYPDVIVTGLVTTPSAYSEGVLLAGTADDGIYRSSTRGRYWETANFGLYDLRVWSLSISPAWETDQTAFAVVGDGLFRSTNGARAWQTADSSDLGDALPQVVAISPNFGEDGTIYLGTAEDGVWYSCDKGKTWQPTRDSARMGINCLAFSSGCAQDYTVYAGTTEQGILHSNDCGRSWERLSDDNLPAVWCLAETVCGEGSLVLAGVQGQGLVRFIHSQAEN